MVYLHYEQRAENREGTKRNKGQGDYSLEIWYSNRRFCYLLENVGRQGRGNLMIKKTGKTIFFTHWKQVGQNAEVYFRRSLIVTIPLKELVSYFEINNLINYNLLPKKEGV